MSRVPSVPGFELVKLLGRGGMGEVYRARQTTLGREVALKLMREEKSDERSRARFLREAEAMARVRHPNLIEIYDSGSVEGHLWIALELIEGAALDRHLHKRGPLEPAHAFEIWLAVCEALGALHQQGLLHRDVKPGNVMIESGGRVVLMDLGLAQASDQTKLTKTGHLLGTPVYLSPELLIGKGWVPSDDFYAVGISWWECLMGKRPFEWDQILKSLTRGKALRPPPPSSKFGPIPPPDLRLIDRLTGPREGRPEEMEKLRRILTGDEEWTAEIKPPGAVTRLAEPIRTGELEEVRPGARAPLMARVAGGLLLAGGLMAWGLGGRGETPSASPTTRGDPDALRLVSTRADTRSFVLEGEAPRAGEVRAWRVRDGRRMPVPVYAMGGESFAVWVTGLRSGEAGRLEVHRVGAPGKGGLAVDYAPAAPGEPVEGRGFPPLLRRFHLRTSDAVALRMLGTLREQVDTGALLTSEVKFAGNLPAFQNFPVSFWPTLLAWLETPGPLAPNLMRALSLAEPRLPPAVSWHLMHRLADDEAPITREHGTAVDIDPFEVVGVPPALFGRLWEWRELEGSGRGRLRLAQRAAQRLAQRPEIRPFPDAVPGWGGENEGAPASDPVGQLGDDPLSALVARAIRARRGDGAALEALVAAGEHDGPEGPWATALLPVTGKEHLIRRLLERFREARGRDLQGVAAALWGFRTVGGFWTAQDQWLLTRGGFPDFQVTRVDAPEGVTVVQRKELGELYAWIPGRGVEVVVHGPGGERVTLEMAAAFQPRRKP